jgi:hypothetical protein
MIYQISYQQNYQLEKVFRLVHELLDINWGKNLNFIHNSEYIKKIFLWDLTTNSDFLGLDLNFF